MAGEVQCLSLSPIPLNNSSTVEMTEIAEWHAGRLVTLVHILKKQQRHFLSAIYALKSHVSGWHIFTEVQSATPKECFTFKDKTDPKLKIKDWNTSGNGNNIYI